MKANKRIDAKFEIHEHNVMATLEHIDDSYNLPQLYNHLRVIDSMLELSATVTVTILVDGNGGYEAFFQSGNIEDYQSGGHENELG